MLRDVIINWNSKRILRSAVGARVIVLYPLLSVPLRGTCMLRYLELRVLAPDHETAFRRALRYFERPDIYDEPGVGWTWVQLLTPLLKDERVWLESLEVQPAFRNEHGLPISEALEAAYRELTERERAEDTLEALCGSNK